MVSRWEVDGFAGVTPPSGTASLVLAIVLLVTLILRPKGITAGKEIPWPGDWKLRRPRLRGAESSIEAAPAAPEASPGTGSATPTDRGRACSMAKKLALLTYSPRRLNEEEYAKFIREIDYPAFRQNPDILDYSCWRVVESVQGEERFTHFDLMEISDFSRWQAITSDPVVRGNVERWTREWSQHGPDHSDQADNLGISFCERYWG